MAERGPAVFREGDLEFAFDAAWQVCSQWDTEAVYSALEQQVPGSKGVDFVGLREGVKGELYLIEVKDYRTSEQVGSTREKMAAGGAVLAEIVAAKVRDTVAGLVGAERADRGAAWRACVKHLRERDVWVVLWIEHAGLDAAPSVHQKRAKVGAVTLLDHLKRRCRWLSGRVAICSRRTASVPGLIVRGVAGARRAPGRRP